MRRSSIRLAGTTVLAALTLAGWSCRKEQPDDIPPDLEVPPSPPGSTVAPPPPGDSSSSDTTSILPAKAPPTVRCNSNYRPCVPIDDDVDCEGGNGNGPSFVKGPVRVVGRDVYHLDVDGDGIACDGSGR